MVRWQFWRGRSDPAADVRDVVVAEGARTARHDGSLPRPRPTTSMPRGAGTDARRQRRFDELVRRRDGLRFDVEQGELARQAGNPWSERVALLNETLTTVAADRESLDQEPREPGWPVPPVPVEHIEVRAGDLVTVDFEVAGERFSFAEAADWDQRGGPVVRGDLRPVSGSMEAVAAALDGAPAGGREALIAHLDDFLPFAADLRDRALVGTPLPRRVTLADLAAPCPECGGWRDWLGTCPRCAGRDAARRVLRQEEERIMAERDAEMEIRHRLTERLPLARRRLADIEAELTSLGPGA
ncbi:MAG: hypothetical protein M3462_06535 [Chloroflexota bacterium]|nr:hypothetical protein [Chloroflexota bacterium]